MHENIQIVATSQNVFSQQSGSAGFFDGFVQDANHLFEFATNVDISRVCSQSIR